MRIEFKMFYSISGKNINIKIQISKPEKFLKESLW